MNEFLAGMVVGAMVMKAAVAMRKALSEARLQASDKYVRCGRCGGTGSLEVFNDSRDDEPSDLDECRACYGAGWVTKADARSDVQDDK